MNICEGSTVDWTAVAAITAVVIWLADVFRRIRERGASARFLAQIMISSAAAAQLEIAKIRTYIVPPSGDVSRILALQNDESAREELIARVAALKLEMPTAVLDRPGVFSAKTSNRITWALVNVKRLQDCAALLMDVEDSDRDGAIKLFLEQIKQTESAIGQAFATLAKTGKT